MIVKNIIDEVFSDYSKISMLIAVPKCTTKCWERLNLSPTICQNHQLHKEPNLDISNKDIIDRYINNPLTSAIVLGGMDSWDSLDEIIEFIKEFRELSDDDCVLYTGKELEIIEKDFDKLKEFKNIYIKYGHYNPTLEPIIDELTKVKLASSNQKFIKIS